MDKISHILSEYFSSEQVFDRSDRVPGLITESSNLPVSPNRCRWEVHDSPERFSRKFKFTSKRRLLDFLSEIMMYEENLGHDGSHRIDGLEITVEVYTHDINRITSLDQEYTRHVDAIYEDVLHFGY